MDSLTKETEVLKRVEVPPKRLAFMSGAADDTEQTLGVSLVHEFQTHASRRHPNIISVLDYGFDENQRPFYTMTYLSETETILAVKRDESASGSSGGSAAYIASELWLRSHSTL